MFSDQFNGVKNGGCVWNACQHAHDDLLGQEGLQACGRGQTILSHTLHILWSDLQKGLWLRGATLDFLEFLLHMHCLQGLKDLNDP